MSERQGPLRVHLVSPLPPPYGGISHWSAMVLKHAEGRGDVQLSITDTAPRRASLVPRDLERVMHGFRRGVVELRHFVKDMRAWRPDVMHLNTSGHVAFIRDIVMLTIARLMHVPSVYHLRFGRLPVLADRGGWEWRCCRIALRMARLVICLDERTESTLTTLGPQIVVRRVANPVRVDLISLSEPQALRQPTALFVGWIVQSKGVEELLSAWQQVRPAGWALRMLGPLTVDYHTSLADAGWLDDVALMGTVDHDTVLEEMRRASVFIFPSHTEGFPNAVVEAMASGMAVIASDVGAIGGMLAGGAGVVVPSTDVEALAEAITLVLDDVVLRDRLARQARERAIREYSLDRVFDQYVALWSSLAPRQD